MPDTANTTKMPTRLIGLSSMRIRILRRTDHADDITTDVRVLPAHHPNRLRQLLGGLTRDIGGGLRSDDHDAFVQKMQSGKSRTLLSSGGNEPVADAGSNGHSVFANALLSGLASMTGNAFTAANLFEAHIVEPVAGLSAQVPQYNVIRNSGHDSGGFRGLFRETPLPP